MKIALCLSGELRRVDLFFPIIEKNILEPYTPDVFISTWNMPEGIPTSVANTTRDPTQIATIDHVVGLFQPVGVHIQSYSQQIKDYLTNIGKTRNDNLLAMAFNILQSYGLAHHRTIITGQDYDLVIRYRFDYGIKIKFEDYDWDKVNIPNEHDYGGYQDQFAFGNQHWMYKYAEWFVHLHKIENAYAQQTGMPTNLNSRIGAPWQPEGSLKRYLDSTRVPVNLIDNLEIRYPWCNDKKVKELYD